MQLRPDDLDTKNLPGLDSYLSKLQETRFSVCGRVGTIVMNCNPFTLGHRYLIEQAALRVRHLFIFVVEEDKSIFPFKERLELVKRGTSDIANVTVLPSGNFIISSLTFVDYFGKSELQDKIIDSTLDVELFGKYIAPTLGVTVRFVGEEPFDTVTRQYNEAMKTILPKFGVELIEIPRKETGGGVISASRVRKLLDINEWEEISAIVPSTTLEYLKCRAEGTLNSWKN
jgi:[citrate (pro-3S)-lyase] ligase